MTLFYEDEVYGTLDLVAVTSVERSELLHKKQQFFEFLQTTGVKIAIFAAAVVFIAIVLRLIAFPKKRRRPVGAGRRVQGRGNYRGGKRY